MTVDTMLHVWVPGDCAAQGSKRYVGHRRNGAGRLSPVLLEQSTAVGPWRQRVAMVTWMHWKPRLLLTGAVGVHLDFVMRRPRSTPKRSTPPAIKRPDGDKMTRAVWDAITGVVIKDDSQIVVWGGTKRIAEIDEAAGCWVKVWEVP